MLVVSNFAEVGKYLQNTGRIVKRFTTETGDGYLFEVRHASATLLFGARVVSTNEGAWLALTVQVCPVARLDLRRALVANSELAIGALSIANSNVLLRQTLPLDQLPADTVGRTITALAVTASALQAAAKLPLATESTAPYAYAFR